MKRCLLVSTALSLVIAGATSAHAQDADTATKSSPAGGEEVIVTAQKRSQALQDVPVSVTAVSGETLTRAAITNVQDLQVSTPGLGVVSTNRPGTGTAVRLRGIGTAGNDAGLEGSVAFAVDGVFRIRSGNGLGDFVDVERVEVLRGPQGTLFGKNTPAGVINVITRKPNYEFGGFVEGSVGNYDMRRFRGVINVPLIDDKLAFRLSGGSNVRDGFIEDVATGATYNDRDRYSISGKLRYQPTENIDWTITVDYAESNEHCCALVMFSHPPGSALVTRFAALSQARGAWYPIDPKPFARKTSVNGPMINSNDDIGVQSELNWSFGDVTLTAISSYREFNDHQDADIEFSGVDLLSQTMNLGLRVHSQELRLQGTTDGILAGLDWLVGVYYSNEKIDTYEALHYGLDAQAYFTFLSPATAGLYPPRRDAVGQSVSTEGESFAIFTHNILSVTEDLRITAGLRYSRDVKEGYSTPFFTGAPAVLPYAGILSTGVPQYGFDTKFEDEAVTGTFAIQYDFTDDIMGYASYSRGYKSGGISFAREASGRVYNTVATCSSNREVAFRTSTTTIYKCDQGDPRFESETADSYEIGLRSQFFDRTLTVNLTGFWAEYENLQVNTFNGMQFVMANAGSARSRGVELETSLRLPVEGLRLGGNILYLDAKYGDDVGVLSPGEPSLSGQPLGSAAKWSGAVYLDFTTPLLPTLDLYSRAELSFMSKYFSGTRTTSTGGVAIVPGYQTVNLAVGLRFDNGVDISAYCRNCLDEAAVTFFGSAPLQTGSRVVGLTPPLEYGLTVRLNF